MRGVNCDVSDETLQSCEEFLEKYPEATNWDQSLVERLMVSFLLLLTRITSFHVYVLERYDICMVRCDARNAGIARIMHMSYRSKTYTWNDVILVNP